MQMFFSIITIARKFQLIVFCLNPIHNHDTSTLCNLRQEWENKIRNMDRFQDITETWIDIYTSKLIDRYQERQTENIVNTRW